MAALAAAVGAAALALASPVGGGFAGVATAFVAVGGLAGSRRLLGVGSVTLCVGVLAAGGVAGAGPGPLLVGGIAAALSWDLGEHAIGLGDQLGAGTDVTRNLATHAAGSLAVGAVAGAVTFGVYSAAAGGQPVVALVFLLVGAIALVSAIR